MMKESLIFFALLIVVLIGFLQAFIGMDSADDNAVTAIGFITTQMVRSPYYEQRPRNTRLTTSPA